MSSAYSPDDSHRLPDPSSRSGSSTPGNGMKFLMYLVFVLALVATIIMFFVDSEMWLNVAVITSLWAAFIGAILVSRYSGVIGEERSRRQELERRHNAEIERERSEAQRREVQLENDFRSRLGAEHDTTLDAIRKELEAMREQLADLSGGDWSNEQVSLKARAERIIELERNVSRAGDAARQAEATSPRTGASTTGASATGASTTRAAADTDTSGQERSGGRRGGFSTGSFAAVRWSGADSEATTQIPMVVDTRSMDGASQASGAGSAATPAATSPSTPSGSTRPHWGQHESDAEPAPASGAAPAHEAAASAGSTGSAGSAEPAEPAPGRRRRAPEAEVEPHGRRRAGESDEGVTVAELMAQMKKNAR